MSKHEEAPTVEASRSPTCSASCSAEAKYLRTVAELQELARDLPHVDQDWVLKVASMDPADMRRRLLIGRDWHGHFSHSLDGIPEIQSLPGAGIDGCRSHKEVRAVVMGLLRQLKTPNGVFRRAPLMKREEVRRFRASPAKQG